jgi:DNA-binding transcriptional regulator YhcF (GntR family)
MSIAHRNKVFGDGRCVPLDGNAKARILAFAKGYSARMKKPGQHWGPITQAYQRVLKALLWGFHNAHTGRCFPSYERIAEAAEVSRATVARAIEALEAAGVLTWDNRLIRQKVALAGRSWTWALRRTSNAYRFIDRGAESQNTTGTKNQDLRSSSEDVPPPLSDRVSAALERLRTAMGASDGQGRH